MIFKEFNKYQILLLLISLSSLFFVFGDLLIFLTLFFGATVLFIKKPELNFKSILNVFGLTVLFFFAVITIKTIEVGFLPHKINFYFSKDLSYYSIFRIILFSPIGEELFYRETLYENFLLKIIKTSPVTASILSSILFCCAHFHLGGIDLLNTFFSGLFFCYIRSKFGLLQCITCHFLFNFLSLIIFIN